MSANDDTPPRLRHACENADELYQGGFCMIFWYPGRQDGNVGPEEGPGWRIVCGRSPARARPVEGVAAVVAATWVEPRVVVEVGSAEVTPTGVLRHAEFGRLRPDKARARGRDAAWSGPATGCKELARIAERCVVVVISS